MAAALFAAAASAQTPEANLRDFDFVVKKITTNYAGFETKVTDANRAEFEALTARLRTQAGAAASDADLEAVLREWIGFFRDGHTQIARAGEQGGDASPTPSLAWTEESVRAELRRLGPRRAPIEGIWSTSGNTYRLGVLRNGADREYAAVVLGTTSQSWTAGQVKAKLTAQSDGGYAVTYRMGDHSERAATARVAAEGAIVNLGRELGIWRREVPAANIGERAERLFPGGDLFMRRLSPQTMWLRIPDFGDNRATPLRALLEEHAAALDKTPNLVIDLRNNGGGSDYVYAPILPLIYTRPIYSIGVEMRATQDNIDLREGMARQIEGDVPEQAEVLRAQNRLMAANLGRFIQPGPMPFSVITFDSAREFPRRVAVLVDGAASTGEQFLLDARQSRKVTLFGHRNSAGVLDFANIVGMETPSGRFRVGWATSRSLRLPGDPVDPDGIAPDIRIPASEADPVAYAQRWLERQLD